MKTRLIRKRGGEGAPEGTLPLAGEAPRSPLLPGGAPAPRAPPVPSCPTHGRRKAPQRARPLIPGTWAGNTQVSLRDSRRETERQRPERGEGKEGRAPTAEPGRRELQRQPARAGAPGEGGYLLNGTDPVAAEGERGAKAQRAGCSLLGSPSGASAIPAPVPSGAPPWDTIRDTEEERGRRPTGARLARSRG